MIDLIIGISLITIEAISISYIFYAFFKCSTSKTKYIIYCLFFVILILAGNALNLHSGNLFVKFMISTIVLVLTIAQGFSGSFRFKLILCLITLVFSYIIDYIVLYSTLLFLNIDMNDIANSLFLHIALSLTSKLLLFYTSFSIHRAVKSKEMQKFSLTEVIQLSILPIVTMYSTMYFFDVYIQSNEEEIDIIVLILNIGLIVANIIFLILIDRLNLSNQLEKEYEMLKQKTEIEMISYKEQRKLTHDFDNHLNVIFQLGSEGKIDDLIEYSKSARKINYNKVVVYTNNSVIDALLNFKYTICQEKNITMTFNINDLSNLSIKNEDIVILLGNAIDNAIEACSKIEDKEKFIHIKLVNLNEHLIISIRNSMQNHINYNLNSTKSNSLEHGYGIKNIKLILNKYNSNPEIEIKNDVFQITAIV